MSYPAVRFNAGPLKNTDPRVDQQVNELLTECPGSRLANAERTILEAPLQLRNGRMIGLQISLPPRFPDVAPIVTVNQALAHPYVDRKGHVKLSALAHWHPGLRLKDLVRNAQQVFSGDSPQNPGNPLLNAGTAEITATLNALSNEDLGTCLLRPSAFQELAGKIVNTLQGKRRNDELRDRNKGIAQGNLSRKMEIHELVNQIAIIKSSEFADARRDFEEKVERQKDIAGRISVPALIESMQRQAREVDEDSDKLQGRFMEKDINVETFCKEYCDLRVKYYTKELKAQAALHK